MNFAFWMKKAVRHFVSGNEIGEVYDTSSAAKALIAASFWEKTGCPYEQALVLFEGQEEDKRKAIKIVQVELDKPPVQVLSVLREARSRSRKQLFAERIGKDAGVIPMGKRFWPLTSGERNDVERLIATTKVKKLITSLTSRENDAAVKLVDAAYWVKGCSSLGLWRAAALVRVGGPKARSKSLALIDIKEALPALAPHSKSAEMPAHHGERVVAGARALSPALGQRMASATVVGKDVFVRELLPQDLKFELESLGEGEALAIGHYLASIVGLAHARQLEPAECAEWLEGFRKGSAKNLKAPAWLWAAVVDLVAAHEGAYLEHCREHALDTNGVATRAFGGIVSHHVTGD